MNGFRFRDNTTAGRRSLIAAAIVIALGVSAYLGIAEQRPADRPANTQEASAVGEQQVFYADMLAAYEAGQLVEARQLARQHLARLGERLLNPPHEVEKVSICHGTLGVLKFMLMFENQLPAGQRFDAQADLLEEIQGVFTGATQLRSDMTNTRPEMRAYLDGETGNVAAEWIRAQEGLVARSRLNETYEQFRDDLERAGFGSLDAVLATEESAAPPASPFLEVSGLEAEQIEQTIDDYFQGLIGGETDRLMDATELDQQGTTALQDALAADYVQEGILTVHSIILPPLPEEKLRLQSNDFGEEVISTTLRGIELDVTMLDGTRKTMTINKRVRLRQGLGGRWVVAAPRD
jgi:hypothetical protein